MTPPGVISLLRVEKPLLGSPFTYQQKPMIMLYIGTITPGTSPELYGDCIKEIMTYFNAKMKEFDKNKKTALFVNTMGWIQGIGALCQSKVRHYVKPTVIIEILPRHPNFSLTRIDDGNVTVFKIPSRSLSNQSGTSTFSASELRNYTIVSYFGQCLNHQTPLMLINSITTIHLSWKHLVLHIMDKKLPQRFLIKALNCSIVALCHVDSSFVLKSQNPDFPLRLKTNPICECKGFAFIRQTDLDNELFHLITPLSHTELNEVNAIIKGNVMVPEEILLKQHIENVALPFTNDSSLILPGLKMVPRRNFRKFCVPKKSS